MLSPAATADRSAPRAERDPAAIPPAGIVLFDGHCTLCSGAVNFLIDRDPHGRLQFAALQSETGRRLLAEQRLPMPDEPDTMVFIVGGKALVRSDAASGRWLGWPWSRRAVCGTRSTRSWPAIATGGLAAPRLAAFPRQPCEPGSSTDRYASLLP